MRLDLFLKKACLVRQRSTAKELCDAGAVRVNDAPAKAAQTVRLGDRVALQTGGRALEVRIVLLPEGNVAKRDAARSYEVLRDVAGPRLDDDTPS